MTNSTNPFLVALQPIFNAPLSEINAEMDAIIANPTLEGVAAAKEKLALDALNPTMFESVGIASAAQEVKNVMAALQSHITTAATSPSVAAVAGAAS